MKKEDKSTLLMHQVGQPSQYEDSLDNPSFKIANFEEFTTSTCKLPHKYLSCLEQFFCRANSFLFLMQLPDSLPCQEARAVQNSPANNAGSDQSLAGRNNTRLNNLEEGQIGKIVRYRSGKFKLFLGTTKFELNLGAESRFLQEAMSISINRLERSGKMINLGPIKAKVEATPNWDVLVKKYS